MFVDRWTAPTRTCFESVEESVEESVGDATTKRISKYFSRFPPLRDYILCVLFCLSSTSQARRARFL